MLLEFICLCVYMQCVCEYNSLLVPLPHLIMTAKEREWGGGLSRNRFL